MLIRRPDSYDDEQWAPVADLMAVVMLIFMLIAMILFINFDLEQRSNEIRCDKTKKLLNSEFSQYFMEWGAVLEEDLTIRFTNQRILFPPGISKIERPNEEYGGWFAKMLKNFFPRYMRVMNDVRNEFGEDEIRAIRIEGHTSTEYINPGKDGPFIRNMELSQDRARKILQYVLNPQKISQSVSYDNDIVRLITANGLSSSQIICNTQGTEDRQASRRVEFKLLTNSCQQAGRYDKTQRRANPCLPEAYHGTRY